MSVYRGRPEVVSTWSSQGKGHSAASDQANRLRDAAHRDRLPRGTRRIAGRNSPEFAAVHESPNGTFRTSRSGRPLLRERRTQLRRDLESVDGPNLTNLREINRPDAATSLLLS
jgi:hypothetical protein